MEMDNVKLGSFIKSLGYETEEDISYLQSKGVDFNALSTVDLTDPDNVTECLIFLMRYSNRMTRSLMIDKVIWLEYLKSYIDANHHDVLTKIISDGTPRDFLLWMRYQYKIGDSVIEDNDYDLLFSLYLKVMPELKELEKVTYDDDILSDVVEEAVGVVDSNKSSIFDELNSEKSTSIRPCVTPAEAFEFWLSAPKCQVHFSLKVDGINTKINFSEDGSGVTIALSRGRASTSLDYTDAVRAALYHQNVDVTKLKGKITCESYVPLESVKILASKYPDKDYKTPKSTAMAMLRAPYNFDSSDIKLLKNCAFDYNGMLQDEAYNILSSSGFMVPPSLIYNSEDIPRTNVEEFNYWIEKNVLDKLYNIGEELSIPSDGVVMNLLIDTSTERKDVYSDRNIALKFGKWKAATYRGVVEEIIVEQKRVEASIVLQIKPVVTRDFNTATRVGVGSPDILFRDDVRVGDTIIFERKSEAYNTYMGKEV